MKKIIIFIFPIIFAACSTDFIDLLPHSTVSIDILYKTDKDFQDAVIGGYALLQTEYQQMYIYGDLRGDDAMVGVIKTNEWSDSDLFILPSTNSTINTTWRNYYTIIYRMNMVLSKIEDADPAVVTRKNQHTGEAKFLRALAYFNLVRIFGDVPLVTAPISATEALETPRTKVDLVYEQIISDFAAAEQVLPRSYTGADVGRATSGAAKTLLGKVYLTRHDFAKAESKLQEVTTMGYALLPNYKDLYDYSKDEHHSEYIFDVEYHPGNNISNNMTNVYYPNQASFQAFHGVVGIGDERLCPHDVLRFLYEDNDLRKDITVAPTGGYVDPVTGEIVPGGWINGAGEFVRFPPATSQRFTYKYLTPTERNNDSPCNYKVTRYADVILMYAEALNENGKTDEALTWLNKVRERAGVAPFTGLSQGATREAIATERRFELTFEGHRWFDLIRTGKALENPVLLGLGMKPHHVLFPVPWSQVMVVNDKSIFWQNEGY